MSSQSSHVLDREPNNLVERLPITRAQAQILERMCTDGTRKPPRCLSIVRMHHKQGPIWVTAKLEASDKTSSYE